MDPHAGPVTVGGWYRPSLEATWQWQLQPGRDGDINTRYDVAVYDLDLFDVSDAVIEELHAAGRRVICYFSAGSFEAFREDAAEFCIEELGLPLEGYADERWLDIRSPNVQRIMRDRLDFAALRGCDGVEPDNVTAFENQTGLDISAGDQLAYNRFLANEAHLRGLAVGLKNDLPQIPELVSYFDFAVNEQCFEFAECEAYEPFIQAGKPVFNAEYESALVEDPGSLAALCDESRALQLRTLVLPVELDDAFRLACDP